MLAEQDGNSDLYTAQWSGSAWTAPTAIELNTGETNEQPFMFVWFKGLSPSHPTISSAASQTFTASDSPTAISTITVTDDASSPVITAANDIRIRIPSSFNMTWETSDTAAVIGGSAAVKVSSTVSYEDGGKTLVVDVTSNFAASDQITISGLSFTSFTAASAASHLELEVNNGGTLAALDDKTIAILAPTLSSAANQAFGVGDPATAISTITVTDDSRAPTITAANDIRIRIPSGFDMSWDTWNTTAVITGSAAAKVSTTVSYEDGGKTLVVDATANFAASDQITISGLSFTGFSVSSAASHLELEVKNNNGVAAYDDKSIVIADIGFTSGEDQSFYVGDPARAISPITITEDSSAPSITAANDIRIRIPDGFNMTWDTFDTTAVITGSAAGKVSTTVSYEDGGKTLVINVLTDFAAGETITISGLSFANFTAASQVDNLDLEVFNNGVIIATAPTQYHHPRLGGQAAGHQPRPASGTDPGRLAGHCHGQRQAEPQRQPLQHQGLRAGEQPAVE